MSPTTSDKTSRKPQTKSPCGCGGGSTTQASPCGCKSEAATQPVCCDLHCFERPNYFSGHLLTDEDLSLDVRYAVEKRKLTNRHLHGKGVVCGLRIACDRTCEGYVDIGEGYAIDDCGNDLVVCATTKFNVVEALKKKKLIVGQPDAEPCEPAEADDDCPVTQCFYLVACYSEQLSDYTAPFQAGCQTGPSDCLPTRVHEKVTFDVMDQLPEQTSFTTALRKRIRKCYAMFSSGPLGQAIKAGLNDLRIAVDGKAERPTTGKDPFCDLFCTLKAHFLHQITRCPDPRDCRLEKKVRALDCRDADTREYNRVMKDLFCELIHLMETYQYDCVLEELIFGCPEPCEPGCVVLGTVEMLSGKIQRVCPTPRRYVWSFANFLPVLFYEIMNGAASRKIAVTEEGRQPVEQKTEGCCPVYETNCGRFLDQFKVSEFSRQYVAETPAYAYETLTEAVRYHFNITDPNAVSIRSFEGLAAEEAVDAASLLGLHATVRPEPDKMQAYNPVQSIIGSMLMHPDDPFFAYRSREKEQAFFTPDFAGFVSPERSTDPGRKPGSDGAPGTIDELNRRMEDMANEIKKLKDQINPGGDHK